MDVMLTALTIIAGAVTTIATSRRSHTRLSDKFDTFAASVVSQLAIVKADIAGVKDQIVALSSSSVTREQHDRSAKNQGEEIAAMRERLARAEVLIEQLQANR